MAGPGIEDNQRRIYPRRTSCCEWRNFSTKIRPVTKELEGCPGGHEQSYQSTLGKLEYHGVLCGGRAATCQSLGTRRWMMSPWSRTAAPSLGFRWGTSSTWRSPLPRRAGGRRKRVIELATQLMIRPGSGKREAYLWDKRTAVAAAVRGGPEWVTFALAAQGVPAGPGGDGERG